MAIGGLDIAGYSAVTAAGINEEITTSIRAIYGDDVDLSVNSLDGQMTRILADLFFEVQSNILDVYNSFRPTGAYGDGLSTIVNLNGIYRIQGTHSYGSLTVYGRPGLTIPEGFRVSDGTTSVTYSTDFSGVIETSGSVTIHLSCDTVGANNAGADALTNILTPIPGIESVTNGDAINPGLERETDAELRSRRELTVASPGRSTRDSLIGVLYNTPGVTDVRVYDEVDTGRFNSRVLVLGGQDATIGELIWLHRGAVTYTGDVAVPVRDIQGNTYTIRFARPEARELYININFTAVAGRFQSETNTIVTTRLIEYINLARRIGSNLRYWDISSALRSIVSQYVNNGVTLNTLTIGLDGVANVGTADIVVGESEVIEIISSRIAIEYTE